MIYPSHHPTDASSQKLHTPQPANAAIPYGPILLIPRSGQWSNGLRAAGTARSRGFNNPLSASSFSHFRQRRNVASRLLNDGLRALHLQFLNRTDTEFLQTTV